MLCEWKTHVIFPLCVCLFFFFLLFRFTRICFYFLVQFNDYQSIKIQKFDLFTYTSQTTQKQTDKHNYVFNKRGDTLCYFWNTYIYVRYIHIQTLSHLLIVVCVTVFVVGVIECLHNREMCFSVLRPNRKAYFM